MFFVTIRKDYGLFSRSKESSFVKAGLYRSHSLPKQLTHFVYIIALSLEKCIVWCLEAQIKKRP